MATARPTGFENKHVEVPQDSTIVDLVTNRYGMFFWEVAGTQTIVAKESHLESGEYNEDNLYSVTTTERFVAIDLRRANDIPNLRRIKEVEQQYFSLCAELSNLGASPLDSYASPPPMPSIGLLGELSLKIWPWPIGNFYFYSKGKRRDKKHQEAVTSWQSLKPRLDAVIQDNRSILNVAS